MHYFAWQVLTEEMVAIERTEGGLAAMMLFRCQVGPLSVMYVLFGDCYWADDDALPVRACVRAVPAE